MIGKNPQDALVFRSRWVVRLGGEGKRNRGQDGESIQRKSDHGKKSQSRATPGFGFVALDPSLVLMRSVGSFA